MNKDIFIKEEGDNFYKRNYKSLNTSIDIITNNISIKNNFNILEIGCSNGYRLSYLKKNNPDSNFFGIDPSISAIENGSNDKDINLSVGTCDHLNFQNNFFDIILIPFVFMYVDRDLLLKSVSEIDRVLKNGGKLIITDFYPNKPRKNSYKHIDGMFIYKQKYFEIFTSTNNYFLQKLECFTHNTSNNQDNYDDTCFYAELIKDTNNLFN